MDPQLVEDDGVTDPVITPEEKLQVALPFELAVNPVTPVSTAAAFHSNADAGEKITTKVKTINKANSLLKKSVNILSPFDSHQHALCV